MTTRISRQQLYDLVWSSPLTALSKQLGVSDVGLGKACRKAEIPLPGLGHWAKRAAGKPFVQAKLPPRGIGKPDEVEIGAGPRFWSRGPTDEEIVQTPIPPAPTFSESVEVLTERARKLVGKVSVPTLDQPHRLIATILEVDAGRARQYATQAYSWNKPAYSEPSARRRLRLLNALFIALTRCGCQPWVRGHETLEAGARVGDQHLSFKLVLEGQSRSSGKRGLPGVPLQFEISWWQTDPAIPLRWQDTEERKLEKQIGDLVVGVLVAGEMHYRTRLLHEHQWRIDRKRELEERARKAAREEAERERQRIARIQKRRRDRLLAQANAWTRAAEIRRFVEAVIAATQSLPADSESHAARDIWVQWALSEASSIDPIADDVRHVWNGLNARTDPPPLENEAMHDDNEL